MKTYNKESGRSMIEMLGVLAIIGVLSVGGIAGYSKAMHKYRVNKAIEQITLIAGNVRAFWGPQKNYIGVGCYGYDDGTCSASGCYGQSSGDGCPIVKKAKIFPDEMITVTDGKIMSIANPFGGGVSLFAENKSKSGDYQAFRISYGVREETEACIELLTYDWSNANASKVCAHHMSTADNCFSTQVPIEDAVTECSYLNIGDGPSVDIYFNM
ncbi:MAG: hypothetical protein IKO06_05545 [Alphaproteobacteria bacterium]|nr:hypothetical protein [Alphaproteobacteria bacterium]